MSPSLMSFCLSVPKFSERAPIGSQRITEGLQWKLQWKLKFRKEFKRPLNEHLFWRRGRSYALWGLVNLPQVGTFRISSSPPLSLAPSSVLFCPSTSVSKFVDVAGPWQLFFFLNFTEHASSSETEKDDFLFFKHLSHRHLNIFSFKLRYFKIY